MKRKREGNTLGHAAMRTRRERLHAWPVPIARRVGSPQSQRTTLETSSQGIVRPDSPALLTGRIYQTHQSEGRAVAGGEGCAERAADKIHPSAHREGAQNTNLSLGLVASATGRRETQTSPSIVFGLIPLSSPYFSPVFRAAVFSNTAARISAWSALASIMSPS